MGKVKRYIKNMANQFVKEYKHDIEEYVTFTFATSVFGASVGLCVGTASCPDYDDPIKKINHKSDNVKIGAVCGALLGAFISNAPLTLGIMTSVAFGRYLQDLYNIKFEHPQ